VQKQKRGQSLGAGKLHPYGTMALL